MLVLIVIAAIVIVAAMAFLATGRGGGMSAERNDYFPLDLGPVSATDVALLQPPTGLWGYHRQATDEAMERIAESIRERDVRIVALEQLVSDLSRDHGPVHVLGSPYPGTRHRKGPAAPEETETEETEAARAPYGPDAGEQAGNVTADETAWLPFEPPGPSGDESSGDESSGDESSAPPEESHD